MRGSSRPSRIAASYVDGGSPPVMSTGLPAAPKGGMNFRKASSRSGGISIRDSPLSVTASDSSTPLPPAPVMITTLSPLGAGSTGNARAYSSISFSPGARMTPACFRMSSYTASSPARAPVCEPAAFAPAAVRPAFSTTTGFFGTVARAASTKARPSLRSSRCMAMHSVCGSSPNQISRSSSSRSDLLPRPTIADTPVLVVRAKPRMAIPMPPDCDVRATPPLTS